MPRLSHSTGRSLAQLIGEIHACESRTLLRYLAVACTDEVIPTGVVGWTDFSSDIAATGGALSPGHEATLARALEAVVTFFPHHPFFQWMHTFKGNAATCRNTDFLPEGHFKNSIPYNEIYRAYQLDALFQLGSVQKVGNDRLFLVNFCRSNRDFTEEEKLAASILGQHFALADQALEACECQIDTWKNPVSEQATAAALARLTRRERQILAEVSTGKKNAAVAEALGISPRTVEKHIESVMTKLGVESRIAAAALYQQAH